MDSSADGETDVAVDATAMIARWLAVGIALAGKRPEVLRTMVLAGEAAVVALLTERELTRH